MASEYKLALKATLDTSQVQQELQRLKQSYTVGSEDRNSFSKGVQGTANMQKLEVQLTRLGQSITGLQRAIEQLSRSQLRNSPNQPASISSKGSGMPALTPTKPNWGQWLNSKEYKSFNDKMRRIFESELDDEERKFMYMRSGAKGIDDPFLAHRIISNPELGKGIFGKKFDYAKELFDIQKADYKLVQQQKNSLAAMSRSREMASIIGGQLFGGAANIASGLGYTGTANVLGAVGSGFTAGGGAAMAASILGANSAAGPIGMLVGLASIFSTLYSSASDAAAAIQKMSEQMNEAFKTLHSNTLNIQRSVQETRHQTNADMLERTGNIEEARKLAEYWKENSQSLQKQFADSDPLAEERKIRERGEARKRNIDRAMKEGTASLLDNDLASFLTHLSGGLNVQENAQKAKNMVDQQTTEQIADMQRKYAAMQQDITSAQKQQTVYQGVVDKLEGQQKNELAKLAAESAAKSAAAAAEVTARQRLNEANDAAIFGYKTKSQLNQTQDFVNGIIGNKSIGALDKFNTIAAELDAARSQKNSAMNSAFDIARYLKQNEGMIGSTEIQAKQKQQAQYDKEAAVAEERIGVLENALASIQTNTIAPDLSHVTSLAQYGFNMGEKDDSVERMEKYYTKSINLQQQIKDKLQEGVKTEAVYN